HSTHFWMVIPKTEDTEKIRAGKDDAPADLGHAHQFADEILRFFYVFEHIQRSDTGEVLIGKWKLFAIINLATSREFSGALDIGFRNIHPVSFISCFGQPGDDLAHATADIQCPAAGLLRLQGI